MSDLGDALYGKEYSEANDKFDSEMKELDIKYPNVLGDDDSFMNYFVMTMNIIPEKITFKIIEGDSELPEAIKTEMEQIFRKHFASKN